MLKKLSILLISIITILLSVVSFAQTYEIPPTKAKVLIMDNIETMVDTFYVLNKSILSKSYIVGKYVYIDGIKSKLKPYPTIYYITKEEYNTIIGNIGKVHSIEGKFFYDKKDNKYYTRISNYEVLRYSKITGYYLSYNSVSYKYDICIINMNNDFKTFNYTKHSIEYGNKYNNFNIGSTLIAYSDTNIIQKIIESQTLTIDDYNRYKSDYDTIMKKEHDKLEKNKEIIKKVNIIKASLNQRASISEDKYISSYKNAKTEKERVYLTHDYIKGIKQKGAIYTTPTINSAMVNYRIELCGIASRLKAKKYDMYSGVNIHDYYAEVKKELVKCIEDIDNIVPYKYEMFSFDEITLLYNNIQNKIITDYM